MRIANSFPSTRISVDAYRCEVVSSSLAKAAAAYSELRSHSQMVVFMYRAGLIEQAINQLSHCIDRSEALIGGDPTDPLLRAELADAINRLGFLRATNRDWRQAEESLDRSRNLSLADDWLPLFNLSYVRASAGEFDAAVALATEAADHVGSLDVGVILHAWFPTAEGWEADGQQANVVSIPAGWVEAFLKLQTEIYRAQRDPEESKGLEDTLNDLGLSPPPAILRLAGWAELTMFGKSEKATGFFDRALHATDLEDMKAVASEYELAKNWNRG